jgi:hypothetical protein
MMRLFEKAAKPPKPSEPSYCGQSTRRQPHNRCVRESPYFAETNSKRIIVPRDWHEHADVPHSITRLLRARRERPSCRAAKREYELSPSEVGCHVTLLGAMPMQRDVTTL